MVGGALLRNKTSEVVGTSEVSTTSGVIWSQKLSFSVEFKDGLNDYKRAGIRNIEGKHFQ